jgi:hypothetical protein
MPELERCPDCNNLTVTTVPAGDGVQERPDDEQAHHPFKQCMTPGCTWVQESP